MIATPTAVAESPSNALRLVLGGAVALAAAIGVGRFAYTPILPSMTAALGLSRFAAGSIASANLAGYLAGALLVAGPRLAPRKWVLGALAASAVTTAAMGLARGMAAFVILRAAGGVASAVAFVLSCSAVLDALAAIRRSALAPLLFSGVGAGIVVSALLIAALRAAGLEWAALWIGSGALSLVAVPACWHLIPPRPPRPGLAREAGKTSLDARFVRLAAAYGLFGFGYSITATFLVALVRSHSATRTLEPVIWVIFGGAAAPSVAFWGRVGRRCGSPHAFVLAALMEAIGVLATAYWRSSAGVAIGSVLIGGTFMGLTTLALTRGRDLAAQNPQRGVALLTSAFGVGQIIGPSLAGALSDRLGGFTAASTVAAAALVASAVFAAI